MSVDLVRRATELTGRDELASDEEITEIFAPDVVLDFSVRIFNPHVYEGHDGLREFYADSREVWEELSVTVREIVEHGDRYLVLTDVRSRARGSGIELDASGAGIWTAEAGRLKRFRLVASDQISRDEALAALHEGR